MPNLPTGTVTFLFTDIEGSTVFFGNWPKSCRKNWPSTIDSSASLDGVD